MIPLAGPANKQGRIVANNICGRDSVHEGSQGTSVVKVFDLTVSTTGLNEKQLNGQGKVYGTDYFVTVIEPKSHASYYPDAFPMTLKVIFDMSGKVLGAQNIGIEGIEKRIDIIATAIRFGGTIYDLQRLELSYAPPYSSAKDPVNMAGFSAENILNRDMTPILWREIDSLDLSYNVIVFCSVGLRGYIAARTLTQMGYKVKNLIGGYNLYKKYKQNFINIKPSTAPEIKLRENGFPI